jgi:adenylate cyclase
MTNQGPDMPDYATTMRHGTRERRLRRIWRMLPGTPRCKLCHSPLAGPLMPVFRLIGKTPWPNNPHYCRWCFRSIVRNRGGAEIETTLLFADVRGSTGIAERLSPQEFRQLMSRFFEVASDVLVEHEAIVDKFVGDEVVAIFIPALTGNHAAQAVSAGLGLLRATGHPDEPWLPIGIGVNTGIAYVGAMGSGENVEMTAMGDTVNVAARLGGSAGSGELLVSAASAEAAGIEGSSVERRRLALRGKSEPTDVLVLQAGRSSTP